MRCASSGIGDRRFSRSTSQRSFWNRLTTTTSGVHDLKSHLLSLLPTALSWS
jgi:hypothetical protein